MHILIIEDNKIFTDEIQLELKQFSFSVYNSWLEFENEGVKKQDETVKRTDLFLLDYELGFDLTILSGGVYEYLIGTKHKDAKILCISSHSKETIIGFFDKYFEDNNSLALKSMNGIYFNDYVRKDLKKIRQYIDSNFPHKDIMPNYETSVGYYLIPTLNKQGWMIDAVVDKYTKEFINYASQKEGYSLEIAAAYGHVSLEVLKEGGKIIANDLDARHLDVLYYKTPEDLRENLKLIPGSCLEELDIASESISSIYCSRVLHFFKYDQILKVLKQCHRMLESRGKIYILADSIFHGFNKDNFDRFLKKKASNLKDPGAVCPQEIMTHPDPNIQEQLRNNLPEFFNLMDIDTMSKLFSEAGFITEKVGYFSRESHYPKESLWDGREGFGIIGKKI